MAQKRSTCRVKVVVNSSGLGFAGGHFKSFSQETTKEIEINYIRTKRAAKSLDVNSELTASAVVVSCFCEIFGKV